MNDISVFPIVVPNGAFVPSHGMTLRDYFAAEAMQGWLSNPNVISAKTLGEVSDWRKNLSEGAYMIADAMLKEREK